MPSKNILIIKQFGLKYILKKSSKVFKREYFILVSMIFRNKKQQKQTKNKQNRQKTNKTDNMYE